MSDVDLELRAIEPGDKVTGLSLGDPDFQPLKTFLQRDAKGYHAQNLAKTYAFFDENAKIVGYITLICAEITTERKEDLPAPDLTYNYKSYPAVKIARLAVDKRFRGNDLGKSLVHFALGMIKEAICPIVGCRFAVVDSKQKSIKFYEKCGFTLVDTVSNRDRPEPIMFLDLHKVP
ncbi:GNAT family N-acetyltransferase [Nitratireductor aquibiodomus]|uniref:GNAT family N-acetyltransferase n=1 Tax=Nitratireductor aquibiodomus TaxID=204799 RepID=UPI0009DE38CF|nr:GNAT family N-acetyltransferase [Nitratireductor aquibiodomus]